MIKRVVPTLIVAGGILMLMFRGVGMAASEADANSNSTAIGAVDAVVEAPTQAIGTGLPLGLAIAGVALILFWATVVRR